MKALVIVAIVLGLVLLFCGIVYFIEPANKLPGFFPGFDPSLDKHHYKHGIGAVLLGIASFIFAWFQSGKKASKGE